MIIEETVNFLRVRGVELHAGLSDAEFADIEQKFGFSFGEAHRELLATAVPVGDGWWDWRTANTSRLQAALDWPLEGTLFDVEQNGFWPDSWGNRPAGRDERTDIARREIGRWPRLIPLCGHRYMPAAPVNLGSPVFSVYQTDVIIYGNDLLDYVLREYGVVRTALRADLTAHSLEPWTLFAFSEDVP